LYPTRHGYVRVMDAFIIGDIMLVENKLHIGS
jgi:hypothetical protein